MARHIVIEDYDPDWPLMYEREKKALLAAVGEYVERIEHIGSTSVPGLGAKPVIDMMIGVASLDTADAHCIEPIVTLGYEYLKRAEASMPNRRYFRKDDACGRRTHPIHLWQTDSDEWAAHILFRDYLRTNPGDRLRYERLKRELAKKEWETGSQYADAKSDFIADVLRKARRA